MGQPNDSAGGNGISQIENHSTHDGDDIDIRHVGIYNVAGMLLMLFVQRIHAVGNLIETNTQYRCFFP